MAPALRHPVRLLASLFLATSLTVLGLGVAGSHRPAAAAPAAGWNIVNPAPADPSLNQILLGTDCVNAWSCWAVGGSFDDSGNGNPQTLVEHWDGTSWAIGSGAVPVRHHCLDPLVGHLREHLGLLGGRRSGGRRSTGPTPLAEHWDGGSWSVVPTPIASGFLFSLTCVSSSNCWGAGTTVDSSGGGNNPLNGFMIHWDGTTWTQVPTAPSGQTYDQFNSVTCASSSDCWTVGFAGPTQSQSGFLPNVEPYVPGASALAEHWDGSTWSVAASPSGAPGSSGTYLDSVTCTDPSQCWAVGASLDALGDPSTSLTERWDGAQWSTVASADSATGSDLLTGVTCLDASSCWAVGADGVESGANQNNQNNQTNPSSLVEHWNGSTWSIDPSPNVTTFSYLTGVTCVRGSMCFADGFAIIGGGQNGGAIQALMEQMVLPPDGNQGLVLAARDGGVFTFGDRRLPRLHWAAHRLNAPIVGMAAAPAEAATGWWPRTAASSPSATPPSTARLGRPASQQPDRGHGCHTRRRRLLAGGLRRRRVLLRRRRVRRFDGRHVTSTHPSSAWPPNPTAAATGWWPRTAGSSASATQASAGSPGGTHLHAPDRRASRQRRRTAVTGWWPGTAGCSPSAMRDVSRIRARSRHRRTACQVVGVTVTPTGQGLLAHRGNGAVYSYGDATFLGSLSGAPLSAPVVAVAGPG